MSKRPGEFVAAVVSSGYTLTKNDDGKVMLDETRRAYGSVSVDEGRI